MQAGKLQQVLLKDGMVLSLDECQSLLDAVDEAEPWIATYQSLVRAKVRREGKLVNSWGRSISFAHERLDDEVYRRAYAFTPQSEIGDLLNQYGLLALHRYIAARHLQSRINLQVHDSLTISTNLAEAYEVASFLDASLSRTRSYQGVPLTIPTTFAIGLSWAKKGKVEYSKLPSEKEFNEEVRRLLGT